MNYGFKNEITRSNKRLRVGMDVEARSEQAREDRGKRALRQHLRLQEEKYRIAEQEREDRERYIIPEHLDLEERLSG